MAGWQSYVLWEGAARNGKKRDVIDHPHEWDRVHKSDAHEARQRRITSRCEKSNAMASVNLSSVSFCED